MKVKCPECKNYTEWEYNEWRPFCSKRCKYLDLASWADEDYKIPVYECKIRAVEDDNGNND